MRSFQPEHIFHILFAALCLAVTPLSAQRTDPPIPGTVLLRLSKDADPFRVEQGIALVLPMGVHPKELKALGERSRYMQLTVDDLTIPVGQLQELLAAVSGVEATHPDFPVRYRIAPNDTQYGTQWGMQDINVEPVWDFTTGGAMANGKRIAVAISDEAIETTHPDVQDNIWPGSPHQGGGAFHGTAVASVVGAVGNNGQGIAGVNWDVDIVSSATALDLSDIIEVFEDALSLRAQFNSSNGTSGALVVSVTASWGAPGIQACDGFSDPLFHDMAVAGILVITSGPNDPVDLDVMPEYPSSCALAEHLVVSTIGQGGQTPYAIGANSVHLLAPGLAIPVADEVNGYQFADGNSFAIPHVAGAIALLYSVPCTGFADLVMDDPAAARQMVKSAILNNTAAVPGGNGLTITGGKLDVFAAYQSLMAQCPVCDTLTVILNTPAGSAAQYSLLNGSGSIIEQGTGDAIQFCAVDGCLTATVVDGASQPLDGTFTVSFQGTPIHTDSIVDGALSYDFGVVMPGCTDPAAANFDASANCDDGSCCPGDFLQLIIPAADFVSIGQVDVMVTMAGDTVFNGTLSIAPNTVSGSTSAAVLGLCHTPGCLSVSVSNATIPLHVESFLSLTTSGGTTNTFFFTDDGFLGGLEPLQELCDGLDNDCDGTTDEDFLWYTDADGDGWGDQTTEQVLCVPPGNGFVQLAGDCNDNNANVNPDMIDPCGTADGIDNNCDGTADEGDLLSWFPDLDNDGFGNTDPPVIACTAPANHVLVDGDCDDTNNAVFPGATEVCDGLDNDCDGNTDEEFLWYTDADGDGFGNDATAQPSCVPVPGAVQVGGDCDDTDATKQHAILLTVLAADQSEVGTAHYIVTQGGSVIEGDIVLAFDEVSFGEAEICLGQGCFSITIVEVDVALFQDSYVQTEPGIGAQQFVTFDGFFGSAGPPLAELCDGLDNDCDGGADEDFFWYTDADGDGFGTTTSAQFSCTQIPGSVQVSGDCDDADPNLTAIGAPCDDGDPSTVGDIVWPDCSCTGFPQGSCPEGEIEDCNGNCAPIAWIGDGYCDDGSFEHNGVLIFFDCPQFFNDGGDCGIGCHSELCDGLDNDCDGEVDEDFIWYTDVDGDGYGDPATGVVMCAPTPGLVQISGDCNDTDATINPGASDLCDGVDRNCDGTLPGTTGNEVYSPDWTATATSGATVNLFSLLAQGKTVVLDLFAAWCPPSQQMLSASFLQDWNAHMGPNGTDGIRIVAIAVDQSAGSVTPFINSAQWPVIVQDGESFGPLYNAIGMYDNAVPTLLMICPDRSVTMLYPQPDVLPYTGLFQYDPQAATALLSERCACRNACVTNIGCMDVNACNHDPSATCPGPCTQAQLWFADNDGDGSGSTPLGISCTQPANSAFSSGDCDDTNAAVQTGFTLFILTDDPADVGTAHYLIQQGGTIIEGDLDLPAATEGIGELPVCIGPGCYTITITQNNVPLFPESYLLFPSDPDNYVPFLTDDPYLGGSSTEICDGIDNDCNGLADEGCAIALSARVFLEGPYNAGTGLMNDGVRALGLVPTTEPYTGLGYTHVGGGGESTSPSVLAITGNDAVVDWVVIELRDALDPSVVVSTRSALLQRDGDVVDTDGSNTVSMPIGQGNYHVAVRHRNHLGSMTLDPSFLNSNATVVDLTLSATATYGTNARKSIPGTFPTQALWAGDVTFNKQLKYAGSNNDRDPILTAIGGLVPTNTLSGQYRKEDINMNGQVKYAGSANDRDILLQNIGGSVPTAVRNAQLP